MATEVGVKKGEAGPQQELNMTDPELINRGNEVIDRLFSLDDAVANARAFRVLLEDLHSRDLSAVERAHVVAISMIRAAILRSAVSTAMACLDPSDRRNNRASVGQILDLLRNERLVSIFPEPGTPPELGAASLDQVRCDYQTLVEGDLFQRGKRLRDDAIAHILIRDDPTPTVTYETIYELEGAAERLVIGLYQVCNRGTPRFLGHQATLTEHAKLFWDTYFNGMLQRTP